MRITVIGGGLAGTLLAWRLAQRPGIDVTLTVGSDTARDATTASGGLVRGYEPDAANGRQAMESLIELRDSPVLREWSGYREIGSLYMPVHEVAIERINELTRLLPGSLSVMQHRDLHAKLGICALSGDRVALFERHAGFLSPQRFRQRLRRDIAAMGGSVIEATADRLRPRSDGGLSYRLGAATGAADAVVIAAGSWTADILAGSGFRSPRLRTKAIQYGIYNVATDRMPPFVDEFSGLYGRPVAPNQMLLGLPTDRWDVPAGHTQLDHNHERQVRDKVSRRLPWLRITPTGRTTVAADAYVPEGRLGLRAVVPDCRLFTFTGGSGGAAKTALAASATAASELLEPLPLASPARRTA